MGTFISTNVYGLGKIDPAIVKSEDACNSDGHPDHNLVRGSEPAGRVVAGFLIHRCY